MTVTPEATPTPEPESQNEDKQKTDQEQKSTDDSDGEWNDDSKENTIQYDNAGEQDEMCIRDRNMDD